MSLEVRYAQLDDYPRLSAFLDTYWAKDHVYVRQRSLFDWAFGRRELWPHDIVIGLFVNRYAFGLLV